MIHLGHTDHEKRQAVEQYCAAHGIEHVVTISPEKFPFSISGADNVTYESTIMYVTFYRLLQEIHPGTLVVLSECLRTQNRYDLTYNCIRNFLNQTNHCLVFQQLPQIDTQEDFMILFDFVTGSRWKRRKWDIDLVLDNAQVQVRPLPLTFNRINVPTAASTQKKYQKEKARRFAALGARDPHTLPRNLYLIGGKDKLAHIDAHATAQLSLFDTAVGPQQFVARNQRLNHENIVSYGDVVENGRYTIIELPHRFIEFSDFMRRTGQTEHDVLVADLKVDEWYWQRYQDWKDRINETYSSLQQ